MRFSHQSLHKELPPFAKNAMICIMKLVALGVIFSLTIIPKVSFTRLLIPNTVVRSEWDWIVSGLCAYPTCVCVSEKFKRVGNLLSIKTIFGTKHALRSSPERNQQQTPQWVYSVPCECGRSYYIGEAGRLLAKPFRDRRQSKRGSSIIIQISSISDFLFNFVVVYVQLRLMLL
jgi:hypothetical protein